jgi:hypothetical protein
VENHRSMFVIYISEKSRNLILFQPKATKYQQKSTVEMSQNDEYFYSFSRLAWDQSETLQNGIGAPALHCGMY